MLPAGVLHLGHGCLDCWHLMVFIAHPQLRVMAKGRTKSRQRHHTLDIGKPCISQLHCTFSSIRHTPATVPHLWQNFKILSNWKPLRDLCGTKKSKKKFEILSALLPDVLQFNKCNFKWKSNDFSLQYDRL